MKRHRAGLTLAFILLAGCNDPARGGRDAVRIVGSSTVFPFTAAVAERFVREHPGAAAPVVESTGTGAGVRLFCGGVGADYPDLLDASRRITPAEYRRCAANGAGRLLEVQIGRDGVTFVRARTASELPLTPVLLHRALIASAHAARTWRDLNPRLPATAIRIFGPPPSSGTRDVVLRLVGAARGDRLRDGGAYVDAGENDNATIARLRADPDAVGIVGYGYLRENRAVVRGLTLNGVAPTAATIASGRYPASRPLYLYVKIAHLAAVPGIRDLLKVYAASWSPAGPLAARGLIPASDPVRAQSAQVIASEKPLDPATLGPVTGAARLMLVAEFGLIAFLLARAAARGRPTAHQHSAYALAWTVGPPLLVLAIWSLLGPGLITHAVLAEAPSLPLAPFERAAELARAKADGGSPELNGAFARAQTIGDWLATASAILSAAGFAWSCRRTRPASPRTSTERLVEVLLACASLTLVLAAGGIVATLLWESLRFFEQVPVSAFLFGTHWSPQGIDTDPVASLGALPLLWGSFFIGIVIAMTVAVPMGLLSAVWLGHYAPPGARRWGRPALEVLAGIPSIVYGWWAILAVAPAIRALGVTVGSTQASGESALAAGLVMGVLAIPYIASATDDALNGVANELRDGSLALGATAAETVVHILLPAALPGIVGGVLLAIGRTVGETMIALLVASAAANVSLDPFAPATTITRQIVDLLTGEATFDGPGPLAAFALGLLLFAATLLLNLVALRVVRRERRAHG